MDELSFSDPVTHVYNPLQYARKPVEDYVKRFTPKDCRNLFLGMNPGPWGMAQTGVPFGSPDLVREFLDLKGEVRVPERTHPKRPIEGLASPRSEASTAAPIRGCVRYPSRTELTAWATATACSTGSARSRTRIRPTLARR